MSAGQKEHAGTLSTKSLSLLTSGVFHTWNQVRNYSGGQARCADGQVLCSSAECDIERHRIVRILLIIRLEINCNINLQYV